MPSSSVHSGLVAVPGASHLEEDTDGVEGSFLAKRAVAMFCSDHSVGEVPVKTPSPSPPSSSSSSECRAPPSTRIGGTIRNDGKLITLAACFLTGDDVLSPGGVSTGTRIIGITGGCLAVDGIDTFDEESGPVVVRVPLNVARGESARFCGEYMLEEFAVDRGGSAL